MSAFKKRSSLRNDDYVTARGEVYADEPPLHMSGTDQAISRNERMGSFVSCENMPLKLNGQPPHIPELPLTDANEYKDETYANSKSQRRKRG